MAYNKALEARIDALGLEWPGTEKMKMFGGLGYTLGGHICVGVYNDSLIVRCGPDAEAEAMRRPGARPGRPAGRAGGRPGGRARPAGRPHFRDPAPDWSLAARWCGSGITGRASDHC